MPEDLKPLAQRLGELATEAVFVRRTAMVARNETMTKRHVCEEITAVLSKHLAGIPPDALHGDRKQIPPRPEWVEAYSASIGFPMDGQKWCDFYEQKGWLVGRARMRDWQSAVRNWKTNGWGLGTVTLNGATKAGKPPTDYRQI
jgi:hypothetical protein